MPKRMTDLPSYERPREKMLQKGPGALTDEELVAVLLGFGIKGHDVMAVAGRIVRLVDQHHGRPDLKDLQQPHWKSDAKPQ